MSMAMYLVQIAGSRFPKTFIFAFNSARLHGIVIMYLHTFKFQVSMIRMLYILQLGHDSQRFDYTINLLIQKFTKNDMPYLTDVMLTCNQHMIKNNHHLHLKSVLVCTHLNRLCAMMSS